MASVKELLGVSEEAVKKLSAAEQRQLREHLQAVKAITERNPLNAYVPYEKQKKFHGAQERLRMFVGGNRAGKTSCGAADDLIQALPPEFVPEHLKPYKKFGWNEPFKGRVITPDLGHTMQVVINKFREMVPKEAIVGGEWRKAFDKTRRILTFECGSVIDFMSTEQDPDKFGGVDLHRVHYDEEPTGPDVETIWQESRWRLLDHGGDILLTMTPLFGYSLVHDQVWERRTEKGIFVIQASVWDNPHVPKKEVEEALRDMTEEEKKARVHGHFVHFGGLFYDEFTDENHVRPAPAPQDVKQWDVIVGIDPGLTRTGVVWVGFDNDNVAFVFDELYPQDAIVKDVAGAIHEKNRQWGIDPDYYVIDPSARVRTTINAEQIETEYSRRGIHCIHGQNARGPGILEVKRRLQGKAIVVSEDCENLIWEFGRYRKDPNAEDEFKAIKKDDHLLDALRYVAMSRPWAGGTKPLAEPEPWRAGWAPPAEDLEQFVPDISAPLPI